MLQTTYLHTLPARLPFVAWYFNGTNLGFKTTTKFKKKRGLNHNIFYSKYEGENNYRYMYFMQETPPITT